MGSRHSLRPALVAACGLCLVWGRAAALDYEPIELACLLARADVVLSTRLPGKPEDSRYRIDVQDVLHGQVASSRLEVQEPAPWRGTPPALHRGEALLFLRMQDTLPPAVLGPSGEGRVMLTAETAEVRALRLPLSGAPATTHPRAAFLGAVRAALRCYRFNAPQRDVTAMPRCDETELKQLKAQSTLHLALLQQLQAAESRPLHCPF